MLPLIIIPTDLVAIIAKNTIDRSHCVHATDTSLVCFFSQYVFSNLHLKNKQTKNQPSMTLVFEWNLFFLFLLFSIMLQKPETLLIYQTTFKLNLKIKFG